MYIIKLTVDDYSEIYKIKKFINKFSINIKRKIIKFKYKNLLELFNKLSEYDINYIRISVQSRGNKNYENGTNIRTS